MSSLLLLTLLASTLAPQISPLVEEGHTHGWRAIIVEGEKEPFGWLDENWAGSGRFDSQTYPLVLIRFELPDEGLSGDAELAVDCASKNAGLARFAPKGTQLVMMPRRLNFNFFNSQPDALTEAIYSQACTEESAE